jgi:hypothetical protein
MQFVHLREKSQINLKCAFCHDKLGKRVLRCPICEIELHEDCFRERYRGQKLFCHARCVTMGCSGLLAKFETAYERIDHEQIIGQEEGRRRTRRSLRRWLFREKIERQEKAHKVAIEKHKRERAERLHKRIDKRLGKSKKKRSLVFSLPAKVAVGVCLGTVLGILCFRGLTSPTERTFALYLLCGATGFIISLASIAIFGVTSKESGVSAPRRKAGGLSRWHKCPEQG